MQALGGAGSDCLAGLDMPADPSRAPLADQRAAHGTALLIIDMISAWNLPDAEKLAPRAVAIATPIGALKRRRHRRWSRFCESARYIAASKPAGAADDDAVDHGPALRAKLGVPDAI